MLQAIQIKLLPSKLMLGLISGVSIACSVIVLRLPIPLFIKSAIIALIVASSIYFILRDVLLRLPNSWQVLEVNQKGELKMINKSGQQFQLIPAPNSFIHAACSVLNFERKDFKLLPPVILLQNAAHADELRRLRVWLHWFKHQEDLAVDLAA